jgi:hypothetical protein
LAAPHIGAVVGHIERQIAKQGDPHPASLLLQALPLPLQMPLQQGFLQKGLPLLGCRSGQGAAGAAHQLGRPLPPRPEPMAATQGHEQTMILEPETLAVGPEAKRPVLLRRLFGPALPQGLPQGQGSGSGHLRHHPLRASPRQGMQIGRLQGSTGHQILPIQQPGVEG